MNENIVYIFILFAAFLAYRKYAQYKVLKLVPSLLKNGAQVVDVRSIDEFKIANKTGSINIPLESFKNRINELDNTKPIILCCASGSRSALAKRMLVSQGFDDIYNIGSWKALK